MKITDENGKAIRAGLPNMKQAVFYAYHDPACQAAAELHITAEAGAGPKGGKDAPEGKGEDPAQAKK
jgi:hypothetical protein